MVEITGKYNFARCFCQTLEDTARSQIQAICDTAAFSGSRIRIMPDVHAGMGCTIGTTMTVADRVVPGMVGVDIGCGMETVLLRERELDLDRLDRVIRESIPAGREVRRSVHPLAEEIDLSSLRCAGQLNLDYARLSIGSLGGGNHFIEVDRADDGRLYLIIHSGSRHLGTEVAGYYQSLGERELRDGPKRELQTLIDRLKAEGRTGEISAAVKRAKAARPSVPKELSYVEGQAFSDYIHDMKIVQRFAVLSRKAMTDVILTKIGLERVEEFTTIHNYIDTDDMILRKGSVSAKKGEKLLIPINMRDGSLICIGRGNEDWNFSAPHGAGRLMSRRTALDTLTMDEFRAEMQGIYTTCVRPDTLDESPMAYKSLDEIAGQLDPTAEIVERIRPIYNFKASD